MSTVAAIEHLIEANPDDHRLYLQLGDALQELDEPVGRRVAVDGVAEDEWADLAHAVTERQWRWGFVEALRLDPDPDASADLDLAALVGRIASAPSARFLRRLELGRLEGGHLDAFVAAFVQHRWPVLKELSIGAIVSPDQGRLRELSSAALGGLGPACPKLETLTVHGSDFVFSPFDATHLKTLRIRAGRLYAKALKSLSRVRFAQLKALEVWLVGTKASAFKTLIASPAWRNLRPEDVSLRYADDLDGTLDALAQSPRAAQLQRLDVVGGPLSARGAQTLSQSFPALRELACSVTADHFALLTVHPPAHFALESMSLWAPPSAPEVTAALEQSPLVRRAAQVTLHGPASGPPGTNVRIAPPGINQAVHPDQRPDAVDELRAAMQTAQGAAAIDLGRQLVALCSRLERPLQQAQAHLGLAERLRQHASLAEARGHLNRAIALTPKAPATRYRALHLLSMVLADTGAREEARQMLDECLTYFRQAGDRASTAYMLQSASVDAHATNELEKAMKLGEEALALAIEVNDQGLRRHLEQHLAVVSQSMGRAEADFRRGLELFRQVDSPRGVADALCNLASLANTHGHADQAREHLTEAVALYQKIGFEPGRLQALRVLADTGLMVNDTAGAEAAALEALTLAQHLGAETAQAGAHGLLADVALNQSDATKALSHAQAAYALHRSTSRDDLWGRSGALSKIAFAQLLARQPDLALRAVEEGRALRAKLGLREGWGDFTLAFVHLVAGRRGDAGLALERALAEGRASKEDVLLRRALLVQAAVAHLSGDPLKAKAALEQARVVNPPSPWDVQTQELRQLVECTVDGRPCGVPVAYEAKLLARLLTQAART